MSSVGTSNCSVWVLLFSASARAQARLFEFLQLRKENLLVFAGWNGCHPIRAIVNFNALTRVLRTPGREELYESLDTSKPLAAHRFALWEPWTGEILARCCGDWGRQKRAKINIFGESLFCADECQYVVFRRRGRDAQDAREGSTHFGQVSVAYKKRAGGWRSIGRPLSWVRRAPRCERAPPGGAVGC